MKAIVNEINSFPLTETNNFNRMFVLKNGKDFIIPKSIRKNPKAKRVYFIKLNQEDLLMLRETFSKKGISKKDIAHNEFAVYNYQIKTI